MKNTLKKPSASKKTTEYNTLLNDFNLIIELSDGMEKRQVIHKLNRILVELEFVNRNHQKFLLLTNREKQIIQLVVEGSNNAEVAKNLFISRRTVEQHRKNINRKLEISCFVELNAFAYAFNLI